MFLVQIHTSTQRSGIMFQSRTARCLLKLIISASVYALLFVCFLSGTTLNYVHFQRVNSCSIVVSFAFPPLSVLLCPHDPPKAITFGYLLPTSPPLVYNGKASDLIPYWGSAQRPRDDTPVNAKDIASDVTPPASQCEVGD